LIKIHKWTCKNCDTRLFLKVDDQDPKQKLKLLNFTSFVTKHCIEKEHEITHKEKEEFKVKFV